MYLKSLVLKGFKSFADRSVLTMEPGITAIVGPNGSGKSNISDAVLWVLGERNAKNLRGQSMEDVIFAGSPARKSTGMAEVTLVLDNSDATLPVDYEEVSIARRMYRTGESEYLINGTVARRMDVLDILHDSGLGTGTHSIISQGALDTILQSKPEDRRALIEEAAGVLKHKQRKAKSERKLERMDMHLLRVRDIVREVGRQMGPLERKAKKARTYQELSARLAELNLQIAVDDLRALQDKWGRVGRDEEDLNATLEMHRHEIAASEKQLEEIQERIRVEAIDAGGLSRQHRQVVQALDRFDSVVTTLRERRRAALDRAGELELSLETSALQNAEAETELERDRAQLAESIEHRDKAAHKVSDLDVLYRDLGVRRGSLERESSALERDLQASQDKLSKAQRKQAESQEALTHGLAHVQVVKSRQTELTANLKRARQETEQADEALERAKQAYEALSADESAARQAVGTALQSRDAARAAFDEARDAHRALQVEISALEEVERAQTASSGEAQAWLTEHEDILEGLREPLSHVLKAEEGYEELTELLLGADLAAYLVQDESAASVLALALEQAEKAGSVSFLLEADRSPAARNKADQARAFARKHGNGSRSMTALIDKLTFAPQAARVVEALLGQVVVCASLEEALRAHEVDAVGLSFATLDGTMVWPAGKVDLGASAQLASTGVLARMRRLEELRDQLGQAELAVETAQQASDLAEEALRAAQATSLELSQKLAALKGQQEASQTQAASLHDKLAVLTEELAEINRQQEEAEELINQARPTMAALEKECEELTNVIAQAKQKRLEIQDELAPLRREAHKVQDELSEAKLEAATLTERVTYNERVVLARVREQEQRATQMEKSRRSLKAKQAYARYLEPFMQTFETLISTAQLKAAQLERQADEAQSQSSGLHDEVLRLREQAQVAHAAFDQVSEKLAEVRVQKGRLELQVESAVNVIVKDCATPLETALELEALENRAEIEDEQFRITTRISKLGNINPDAADEYDELKTRFDYLNGQLNDLDAARSALAKITRVIDRRMKDDFIDTYHRVDENFQHIFSELFPGGSAHLSLVDPDDLENTGVEVNAQPRGKRISKMTLMSGGEKSLTALALLFAVYRTRSTPFYILDEVEAALDDTNLRRLAAYIDTLRADTQLIMITHQRRTMEMADVLFGVSMQGDGITKVVSQKLDHALRFAEE